MDRLPTQHFFVSHTRHCGFFTISADYISLPQVEVPKYAAFGQHESECMYCSALCSPLASSIASAKTTTPNRNEHIFGATGRITSILSAHIVISSFTLSSKKSSHLHTELDAQCKSPVHLSSLFLTKFFVLLCCCCCCFCVLFIAYLYFICCW